LGDNVGGLKEELDAWKLLRQLFAQIVDVCRSWLLALGFELHQNFRISSAESSCVAVTQVQAAVRHAQVIKYCFDFSLRNCFSNDAADRLGKPGGFLNAQPGTRAEVQANLTGIHR